MDLCGDRLGARACQLHPALQSGNRGGVDRDLGILAGWENARAVRPRGDADRCPVLLRHAGAIRRPAVRGGGSRTLRNHGIVHVLIGRPGPLRRNVHRESAIVLSVKSLSTEYPGDRGRTVVAARDVSFEVPAGKLFTLLGPSGCGKTTTLRSIAGLERPSSGEIEVAGKVMYSSAKRIFVAPNKRNFGMVFQSYAIWPHMNVFQNVAFPLQVRRLGKKLIREKVMRMLEAVALENFVDRDATKLSGGQQQRLALARALVMEPQLLLLDEPLSNLDAKLRERMRFELKRIQRELGLTTVYVTHDQSEALALSHMIALMNQGRN